MKNKRKKLICVRSAFLLPLQADSRDAIVLAQVLGGTLEEARAGEISWLDRELVGKWLDRNGKLAPVPCSGLCR